MTFYVVRHGSGFYYPHDETKRIVDRFCCAFPYNGTSFSSVEKAQKIIDEKLQEFTQNLLTIEPVEHK